MASRTSFAVTTATATFLLLGGCTGKSEPAPAVPASAASDSMSAAPAPAAPTGRAAVDAYAAALARDDLRAAASLIVAPLGPALVRRVSAGESVAGAADRLCRAADRRFGAGTAAGLAVDRPTLPFPLSFEVVVDEVVEKDGAGEAKVTATLPTGATPRYTFQLVSGRDGWRIRPIDPEQVAVETTKDDAIALRWTKSASLYDALAVQVDAGTLTLEKLQERLAYGRSLDAGIARDAEALHEGLRQGVKVVIK